MTEQLPAINTSHNVTATKGQSNSLLGRGLAAIQRKETGVVLSDLDSRYRQARDIYNRIIAHYDLDNRFNVELLPKQEELLKDPQLLQLQPFYTLMQQLAEAFNVFQQLANQGYGKAYFPLALMYEGGQGISQDIEKANHYKQLSFDWCFANKTSNDLEIWNDLGWMYWMHYIEHHVKEDYEQAVFWYRKAAEQGHTKAQYNLCNRYGNQQGDTFWFWLNKAAEQGDAQAQNHLGNLSDSDDYEQSEFWYRKAAEQGHAQAQVNLALTLEDYEKDYEEAVLWFRKAAEQGHARAQYKLGLEYESGRGVEQDYKQAVFWYLKAAEQSYYYDGSNGRPFDSNNPQYRLGLMYYKGRGIEKDYKQAVFWFRKAAEQQGSREAQEYLTILGINWQES